MMRFLRTRFILAITAGLVCLMFFEGYYLKFQERLVPDVYPSRVLCWITMAAKDIEGAKAVQDTWGRHCDTLLFMTSKNKIDFPRAKVVPLEVDEGRQYLTIKTFRALEYLYKNHLNESDWFLKADTDTFVFMDNLRSVVSAIDSRLSWYLGVKMFYHPYKLDYHSGGAGHVLSRMALKKMVEEGTKNKTACPFGGLTTLTFEDVMTGLCLKYVGIQPTEVMDGPKRAFNAFHPLTAPGKNKPIITLKSLDNYGSNPISFHHLKRNEMYLTEYIIKTLTSNNGGRTKNYHMRK